MSIEYNSKLIQSLYEVATEDEAIEIIKEMEEVKDNIFIYPIYSAFKKYSNRFSSHYYVSAFEVFDSPDVLKIIKEIANKPVKILNYIYCFPVLSKYGCYEEVYIASLFELLKFLSIYPEKSDINDEWMLSTVLDYLSNAGKLSDSYETLKEIFQIESINKEVRTVALSFFLKSNSSKAFDFLIDNFNLFSESFQIILSKQIIKWEGNRVDKIKTLIKNGDVSRAKEIIEQFEKKAEEKKQVIIKESKQKEIQEYGNVKIVTEIISIKEEINRLSVGNEKFGFPILESDEKIISQQKTIIDESTLVLACNELRISLTTISDKLILPDRKEEILLNPLFSGIVVNDLNKPLNKLWICLSYNEILVDGSVFGLRTLNKITSLIGPHKDQQRELVSLLKTNNMYSLYTDKKWDQLHTKFLEIYRDGLTEMKKALQICVKAD